MHAPSLIRLRSVLQDHIDRGILPGAVALVHHRGQTLLHEALGAQAPGAGAPAMAADSIFRIYSMTKPVVSLVTLMLMEEGRLPLSHPVARYLPSFAGQGVLDPATGGTTAVRREATVHDLLRHTAGLSYAWDTGPVAQAYQSARIGSRRDGNAALAKAIGPLPLLHQPGRRWEYSRATDVLGALLEVVEGEPLSAILQRRVFGPLQMHDTGFHVPAEQLHRLAEPFARDPQTGAEVALNDVSRPATFESGGGGLVSTAGDYARFARLLLAGGTLDGVRLASRATVAFMAADHLGDRIPAAGDILPEGYGFGLGVAVRRATGLAPHAASVGQYGWSGMGGTYFLVDPAEDLVAILLTQAPGQLRYLCELYPALVYAAL